MARTLESQLARVGRLWQRLDGASAVVVDPDRPRLDGSTRAANACTVRDEVAGTLCWLARQGLTERQIRIVLAVSAMEGERDFAHVARTLGISRQGVRDAWLRAWRKLSPAQAAADGLLD